MMEREKSDGIRLWCGKQTSGDRETNGAEHIFPKAKGGRKTLPAGSVCTV